jgi:hypothetical protein
MENRARELAARYRNRWVMTLLPDIPDTMWKKYMEWTRGFNLQPLSHKGSKTRERNAKAAQIRGRTPAGNHEDVE